MPVHISLTHGLPEEYTKTPFDDVRYHQGSGPEFSCDEWLKVKETLQLDFPNLPYLIDGDLRMTQSMAIILYLAEYAANSIAVYLDACP